MRKHLLFCALLFCSVSGLAQITFSNVSHLVQANNVLRYDVSFNTNTASKTWVDYYFVDAGDTVFNSTGITTNASTNHALTIIGIVPQTDYTYSVNAFDVTGCYASAGGTFTSDTLPAALPFMDSLAASNDEALPGYFMTNAHSAAVRTQQIYDRKGRLIWYENPISSTGGTTNNRCRFFEWNNERQTLLLTDCHRIIEQKLDGTIVRDIDLSSRPDLYLHHDMTYNNDGNLVAIVSQQRAIDQSSVGGSDSTPVMGQGFIEIDDNDNIVTEWHTFEHFDTLTTPAPGGYWAPIVGPDVVNWMHGNALTLDFDGHYIMSFKIEHQLAKIDRNNGTVLWKMGGTGSTIDVLPQDTYMDQHCINISEGTDYLIFDNTGLDSITRVMQFWVDFAYLTPMLMVTWDFTLPQDFATDILGSVYRLPNGNTMIGTGRSKGVFEVNSNGNVVWMGRQSEWVYRSYYVEDLYENAPITSDAPASVCEDDFQFPLIATPSGGIWSGPGVSNNIFYPAIAGIGFHDLVYKYGYEVDTFVIDVQDPAVCITMLQDLSAEDSPRIFPNPFNEGFTIVFQLPAAIQISADLLDIRGKRVATLFDRQMQEGTNRFEASVLELSAGLYFVRFTTESGEQFFRPVVKR
jgi:hypothetical protein